MAFVTQTESAARKKALMQNEMLDKAASGIQSGLQGFAAIDTAKRQAALLEQKATQDRIKGENDAELRANTAFNQNERSLERNSLLGDRVKADTNLNNDRSEETKRHNKAMEGIAGNRPSGKKTSSAKTEEQSIADSIPGYESTTGIKASSKEVSDLRSQESSRLAINQTSDDLKGAFDDAGYFDRALPWGKKNQKINTLITDLQLQSKEAAKLGALSGPDLDLVNSLIGKFTGPVDAFKSKDDAKQAIDEVKNVLGRKVGFELQTRGYKPKATQVKIPTSHTDIKSMTDEELKAFVGT